MASNVAYFSHSQDVASPPQQQSPTYRTSSTTTASNFSPPSHSQFSGFDPIHMGRGDAYLTLPFLRRTCGPHNRRGRRFYCKRIFYIEMGCEREGTSPRVSNTYPSLFSGYPVESTERVSQKLLQVLYALGYRAICGKIGLTLNPGLTRNLAFIRYCHQQYCRVYGIQQGGRGGGVVYCVIDVQTYCRSADNAGRRG